MTLVNESSSPASITAAVDGQPYEGFRSHVEACEIMRQGLSQGTLAMTVTSSSDRGELSMTIDHAPTDPAQRTIVIDPTGHIDMDAPNWPGSTKPC